MADYAVTFTRSARKELQRLPAAAVELVFPRIAELAKQPRPAGCRKLEAEDKLWRIRIGDYRVIYSIDDKSRVVDIRLVRHRADAYR
jgi:mRNA interferase RelE/StbE